MPALSLPTTLFVFAAQCLVFSGAGVAAQIWRRHLTGRGSTAFEAILLGALAPCVLGYLAFAAYFAHPLIGRTFSWLTITLILGTLAHTYLLPLLRHLPLSPYLRLSLSPSQSVPSLHTRLLLLTALAGTFYLSALFVFTHPTFTQTARERFNAGMPGDNEIPRIFAERLYTGVSSKHLGAGWLSSDRPPLQTGLALVTFPALRALDFGYDKACATAGLWFQLLWIPALWVFLRWLGLTEHQAHAATAALVFTGFLLFNSVFVWPKLAAAALVLLACCTFFATESAIDSRHRWPAGAALAAFGFLSHGGVMFSLLTLAPLILWHRWRTQRRTHSGSQLSALSSQLFLPTLTFLILVAPWFAYQKFYEPPANRLLKWHLAGAVEIDPRPFGDALVENYRALGWSRALENRRENLEIMFLGAWQNLLATRDRDAVYGRRSEETFHTFRAPALWIFGTATLPFLAYLYLRRRPAWRDHVRRHGLALAWLAGTLALWLALMFAPFGTLAHQGSYVVPLLLLGLLTAWTLFLSRWLFVALAAVQIVLFALTWLPPSTSFATTSPSPLALALTAVTALFIAFLSAQSLCSPSLRLSFAPALLPRLTAALRSAWTSRQSPWWLVVLAALAFALRKSWALHTPQLFAEDGSIFLTQQDEYGLRALIEPYMGYLHTIPRLIAFGAAHLADPAWWPALYNGSAFALTVALFFRLGSARCDLPAKPLLLFSFAFVAHTGEVPLNVTNLQWIAAFFLILHPFLTAPTTTAARVIDLTILVLVGLTGPFSIILAPVYLWHWWRDRRPGKLLPLLVLGACAVIQVAFILTSPAASSSSAAPFRLLEFLSVIGSRLVVWSFFGADAVAPLAHGVRAALTIAFLVGLSLWALRSHPRRPQHVLALLTFFLISAACFYRTRHDAWDHDNLENGDRYFYIPRVLLFWLVAWGCDAPRRWLAWTTTALVLVGFAVHLPAYFYPTPPNYHWADHCDPIRRGVPAQIPTLPEGWIMKYCGRLGVPQPP